MQGRRDGYGVDGKAGRYDFFKTKSTGALMAAMAGEKHRNGTTRNCLGKGFVWIRQNLNAGRP